MNESRWKIYFSSRRIHSCAYLLPVVKMSDAAVVAEQEDVTGSEVEENKSTSHKGVWIAYAILFLLVVGALGLAGYTYYKFTQSQSKPTLPMPSLYPLTTANFTLASGVTFNNDAYFCCSYTINTLSTPRIVFVNLQFTYTAEASSSPVAMSSKTPFLTIATGGSTVLPPPNTSSAPLPAPDNTGNLVFQSAMVYNNSGGGSSKGGVIATAVTVVFNPKTSVNLELFLQNASPSYQVLSTDYTYFSTSFSYTY